MIQFRIQADSEISASSQLFNQIGFAIASRQYPPGYKLPSTRALAMQTGLHRNTISKVYRQLEEDGFVQSLAGSGIYVRPQGHEIVGFPQSTDARTLVQQLLNHLLSQGYSLSQARELFLTEVDWRLSCGNQILVVVPSDDIGAGELMVEELKISLEIPITLVLIEELADVLDEISSATVVTSRYFINDLEAITTPKAVRVIPLDIYDYTKELDLLKTLPKQNCVGIVSLSSGISRAAEVILHGLRGDELLVMTSHPKDEQKLKSIVKRAEVIISDQPSFIAVQASLQACIQDIIRPPKLIKVDNYIGNHSLELLKRELGLS